MGFEFPRSPVDKPGGGGGDDREATKKLNENLMGLVRGEGVITLKRFFTDRHEIGEQRPQIQETFTSTQFIEVQFAFDKKRDRERGYEIPAEIPERYKEAIQTYLDALVQGGYLTHNNDETYQLTEKGKSLIPRLN